ncbi:hypothetical protein BAN20980_06192 [Burkholderia anthina]|uniref:Uncharacterized protein n=1 Tax=Burkholderia anthina TaxID=179879 RepID=A0A6P2GKN4_9BURK|nr:hypothetical protein BAN20980_06192 [Burkholderia anthina]
MLRLIKFIVNLCEKTSHAQKCSVIITIKSTATEQILIYSPFDL